MGGRRRAVMCSVTRDTSAIGRPMWEMSTPRPTGHAVVVAEERWRCGVNPGRTRGGRRSSPTIPAEDREHGPQPLPAAIKALPRASVPTCTGFPRSTRLRRPYGRGLSREHPLAVGSHSGRMVVLLTAAWRCQARRSLAKTYALASDDAKPASERHRSLTAGSRRRRTT
jgi:hypothetical protein